MKPCKAYGLLILFIILFFPLNLYAQQIRFGTYSGIGFESKFDSRTFEPFDAWTQFRGLLRFQAEAFGTLYINAEMAMEGGASLYNTNNDVGWGDGWKHFFTDMLTNPIAYYSNPPSLDQFRMTFQNPWVITDLGYKYAKLPWHQNALWMTVDGDWDAGYNSTGGFVALSTGSRFTNIGPVRIKAVVSPNKSADRAGNQYGFFGWISGDYRGHLLDFQYNGAYGKNGWDSIFDEIYEADYILGYSTRYLGLGIQANLLMNIWGAEKKVTDDGVEYRQLYTPSSSDVVNALPEAELIENMASAVRLSYDLTRFRAGKASLGYRFRGSQANLMYVKQDGGDNRLSDQLGYRNTQYVYVNYTLPPLVNSLSAGINAGSESVLYKNGRHIPYNNPDNVIINFNPWFDYDLRYLRLNARVWGYMDMSVRTAEEDRIRRGGSESAFLFSKAGIRVETGMIHRAVRGVEVFAGFDNQEENYWYNTYLATVKLPRRWNAQGGFMMRIPQGDTDNNPNPLGFFAGAVHRLPIISRPVLYAQFLWNMNPYKGFNDGIHNYDLDGYLTSGWARNSYSGDAAIRAGLRWEL